MAIKVEISSDPWAKRNLAFPCLGRHSCFGCLCISFVFLCISFSMNCMQMLIPGKNKDAQRLVEWVEYGKIPCAVSNFQSLLLGAAHDHRLPCAGLHDAVGRQYLESMSFGVSQDAAQTQLLEEFTYKFSYDMPNTLNVTDRHGNSIELPTSQASQVIFAELCAIMTSTFASSGARHWCNSSMCPADQHQDCQVSDCAPHAHPYPSAHSHLSSSCHTGVQAAETCMLYRHA
jgi:hypothetical protein